MNTVLTNYYLAEKNLETQNYNHHKKYYIPHHLVFYLSALVLLVISLSFLSDQNESTPVWLVIAALVLLVTGLSLMLRQHYALGNQNRIIRLEMRLRYYILTQKRFEEIEKQLSKGQVLALRFAPDEELPSLVEKAIRENLTPDQIKKSVRNWLPDHHRV